MDPKHSVIKGLHSIYSYRKKGVHIASISCEVKTIKRQNVVIGMLIRDDELIA